MPKREFAKWPRLSAGRLYTRVDHSHRNRMHRNLSDKADQSTGNYSAGREVPAATFLRGLNGY